eukprot:3947401-Prymnesium_polylepis.1
MLPLRVQRGVARPPAARVAAAVRSPLLRHLSIANERSTPLAIANERSGESSARIREAHALPLQRGRRPYNPGALPVLDPDSLASVLSAAGVKAQHTRRVLKRVLRGALVAPSGQTSGAKAALKAALSPIRTLPSATAEAVADGCVVYSSRVVEARTSADGSTTKLLIELHDGHRIET